MGRKRKIDSQAGPSRPEGSGKKRKTGNRTNENPNNNKNLAPQNNQMPLFPKYTPTTMPVTTIYNENEHLKIFTIPPNIRTLEKKRSNSKYCRYHQDIVHTIEECQVLKDEVERLIQQGQLKNYVRDNVQQPCPQAQPNKQTRKHNQISRHDGEDIEVRTIIGGPASRDTNQARKNYARQSR